MQKLGAIDRHSHVLPGLWLRDNLKRRGWEYKDGSTSASSVALAPKWSRTTKALKRNAGN